MCTMDGRVREKVGQHVRFKVDAFLNINEAIL
jgi:hypothetical protein